MIGKMHATNNKFKNKYRISSNRLANWNYGQNGYYFITICTKNRKNYFGEIINKRMSLSNVGTIANQSWLAIPQHFSNVILDEFVIMPNHVHGILIINNDGNDDLKSRKGRFQNQGAKTISAIVGSYKSACTKTINQLIAEKYFAWQTGFYDHIIQSEKEWQNIVDYIFNNPINWQRDENYLG